MNFSISQIAVAFGVGQLRDPHVVAGNGEQERIGEQEIGVGDLAEKVVADAEGQVEAVEALRGQHGEVPRPHLAVVVPGLVFHVAGEQPGDAADGVGGALDNGAIHCKGAGSVSGILHAIPQFEHCID